MSLEIQMNFNSESHSFEGKNGTVSSVLEGKRVIYVVLQSKV
jgi:hypothetical protein